MREALSEASKRRGYCAPNPAVGAVLVRDGRIIAAGHHWAAGRPHAEVEVLSNPSVDATQSTLYVTLEPCCHWGKTPPCTQLIIQRKVGKVVYGFSDPNPKVSGGGIRELRESGIECEKLTLPEIDDFYRSYAYWTVTGRPFVTAKLALTLDGRIAEKSGKPVQISEASLQKFTHEGRRRSDALLTSAQTLIADNPKLNVRIDAVPEKKTLFVLDRHLRTPLSLQIFDTAERITFLHSGDALPSAKERLLQTGARCVQMPSLASGLCWEAVLEFIGSEGFHDIWVEAGGKLFASLASSGYLNRAYLYVAPRLMGSLGLEAFADGPVPDLTTATRVSWSQKGDIDALCQIDWDLK